MDLKAHRDQIDLIDSQIAQLLNKRFSISEEIGKVKADSGKAVEDPNREKIVLDKVSAGANNSIAGSLINVYRCILEESKKHQRGIK